MASKEDKESIVTAYKQLKDIPHQEQNLPGLDSKMDPLAEFTKLECWDDEGKPYLKEYEGNNKLKGKAALITGGDSGIGRSAAQMFAREGADVTIVYLPQEESDAQSTKEAIERDGRKCQTLALDLMDEKNCQEAVKKHMEAYGRLDVLVNNASKQIMCADLAEIDLSNVESTFRSNILSMFAVTKFALPHLKRGASIINTSSVTAFKGSQAMVDYSSTKGAIITFTRSMAMQLAPKGIRINVVCPGPVHTPLQPASRPGEQMEDFQIGKLPLWGRANMPAEMGPAYVFLACADSNAMTGQCMHLNNAQWIG